MLYYALPKGSAPRCSMLHAALCSTLLYAPRCSIHAAPVPSALRSPCSVHSFSMLCALVLYALRTRSLCSMHSFPMLRSIVLYMHYALSYALSYALPLKRSPMPSPIYALSPMRSLLCPLLCPLLCSLPCTLLCPLLCPLYLKLREPLVQRRVTERRRRRHVAIENEENAVEIRAEKSGRRSAQRRSVWQRERATKTLRGKPTRRTTTRQAPSFEEEQHRARFERKYTNDERYFEASCFLNVNLITAVIVNERIKTLLRFVGAEISNRPRGFRASGAEKATGRREESGGAVCSCAQRVRHCASVILSCDIAGNAKEQGYVR